MDEGSATARPPDAPRSRRHVAAIAETLAAEKRVDSATAAELCHVSPGYPNEWGRNGLYGARKIGHWWTFVRDELPKQRPAPKRPRETHPCARCGTPVIRNASRVRETLERGGKFYCPDCWPVARPRISADARRGKVELSPETRAKMGDTRRRQWAEGLRDREVQASVMRENMKHRSAAFVETANVLAAGGQLMIPKVAARLHVSVPRVDDYIRSGLLPVERHQIWGTSVRTIREEDLKRFTRDWALSSGPLRRVWLDPERVVAIERARGTVAALMRRHGLTEAQAEAILRARVKQRRRLYLRQRAGATRKDELREQLRNALSMVASQYSVAEWTENEVLAAVAALACETGLGDFRLKYGELEEDDQWRLRWQHREQASRRLRYLIGTEVKALQSGRKIITCG